MKDQKRAAIFRYLILPMIAITVTSTCWPRHVQAGKDERPSISTVEIYLTGAYVSCDIKSSGMISEKISGTIRSGLPAVIELFYYLIENDRQSSGKGARTISVNYDVWDDIYTVTSGDSAITIPGFDAMRMMVEHLRNVHLFPSATLAPGASYRVRICVSVNPFSESETGSLKGWVDDNVNGGGEGWKEQVLNINDLISFFFNREKGKNRKSKWFTSDPFTITGLPIRQALQDDGKGDI